MTTSLLLEKYVKVAVKKALKEQEAQQQQAEKSMYLIYRFPKLKELMENLMSPAFGRYIKGINIIAPKPTTFKVDLINGQDFNIKYVNHGNFLVKISGKKYNPINLGELERASQSIADLLELNYAPAEGKEQSSHPSPNDVNQPPGPSPEMASGAADFGPDIAAADNEPLPQPEETPTEKEPELPKI